MYRLYDGGRWGSRGPDMHHSCEREDEDPDPDGFGGMGEIEMLRAEVTVIGAGPAGMSAACEAAKAGAHTILIDEYVRPGGQMTKQIHKFFGSKEHRAGVRGIDIARELFHEVESLGIQQMMATTVWGFFASNKLGIAHDAKSELLRTEKVILATGASENALAFPGWTLPGVMGAGAAQTLINLHRVLPGQRVLMVGAGNVGCIIAYQLMQAGAEVVAVVEAQPTIGAYSVHSAKIAREGVRILTSHTVKAAQGVDHVNGVTLVKVDKKWRPIEGTEQDLEVDTICVAVGLSPLSELGWLAKCKFTWVSALGGYVPLYTRLLETTVKGVYVAGDCAGIEEASTAMEEGRIAGISAAEALGYVTQQKACAQRTQAYRRLQEFRAGPFGQMRVQGKETIWREMERYEERL